MIPLSSFPEQSDFDAVVVGTGMVGAGAALALEHIGYRVLTLDAYPLDALSTQDYAPSYDARSTALSWGSHLILERLGVWAQMAQHACLIRDVHVSQKGRFGTTRITSDEMGYDALGYVIPNQWIGTCLLSRLSDSDVELCAPAAVASAKLTDQGVEMMLTSETSHKNVRTRLLVIADGNQSATSHLLGINHYSQSYSQHAVIANVTTELPNEGVAYERFTAQGPLALLPLSAHDAALVWTHDSDRVNAVMTLSDEAFSVALREQFGDRLGRFEKIGKRVNYPLSLVRAEEQTRPGVVLLGNAAHSLHPVAGQGFNLALRGVAALVDALCQHTQTSAALSAFEERQHLDQLRTISASDQLVKLFGQRSMLVGMARDAGLIGLNAWAPAKNAFARAAMGLATRRFDLHANKEVSS